MSRKHKRLRNKKISRIYFIWRLADLSGGIIPFDELRRLSARDLHKLHKKSLWLWDISAIHCEKLEAGSVNVAALELNT